MGKPANSSIWRNQPWRSPLVIVEFSGGVAEITHSDGNVEVVVVDWDNLDAGGMAGVEEALNRVKNLRAGETQTRLLHDLEALRRFYC